MAPPGSRRLLKELPTEDEMTSILVHMREQSAHALAIMSVAYLEHALEGVLRTGMPKLSKEDDNRLFNGAANGIMGTFSTKIRIAYAFHYLGQISYHDLLLINNIRNVFGHSMHKVDFTHELIKADCNKLQSYKEFIKALGVGGEAVYPDGSYIFSKTVEVLYVGFLNQIMHLSTSQKIDHSFDSVLHHVIDMTR